MTPTDPRPAPPARPDQHPPGAERGSITVFALLLAALFLTTTGLLLDGGRALTAKTDAISDAQQAARAAATAIDPHALLNGTIRLDPGSAARRAEAYLTTCGETGTVTIHGQRITVTAHRTLPTEVLDLFGLAHLTVTGTGTAVLEPGIARPFDLPTDTPGPPPGGEPQ